MKFVLTSYIASFLIRFWFLFIKKSVVIPPETEEYLQKEGGFILAGWHNQILSLTHHVSRYLQKKRRVYTTPLVSLSKDGELIYQTFLRFGMESVRGSSSRGGVGGMRALLKAIKQGKVPIFTPDGPRGPIYVVQEGVVQSAAMTGLPIVAFYSIFDKYHEFKSWDKHRFPKFFAKQWIVYSKPFLIPRGSKDIEGYREKLQQLMTEQMQALHKEVGADLPNTNSKENQ
ncbi:MAG: DUF374 domain-containing protein [Spirochaetota bacterium]